MRLCGTCADPRACAHRVRGLREPLGPILRHVAGAGRLRDVAGHPGLLQGVLQAVLHHADPRACAFSVRGLREPLGLLLRRVEGERRLRDVAGHPGLLQGDLPAVLSVWDVVGLHRHAGAAGVSVHMRRKGAGGAVLHLGADSAGLPRELRRGGQTRQRTDVHDLEARWALPPRLWQRIRRADYRVSPPLRALCLEPAEGRTS